MWAKVSEERGRAMWQDPAGSPRAAERRPQWPE